GERLREPGAGDWGQDADGPLAEPEPVAGEGDEQGELADGGDEDGRWRVDGRAEEGEDDGVAGGPGEHVGVLEAPGGGEAPGEGAGPGEGQGGGEGERRRGGGEQEGGERGEPAGGEGDGEEHGDGEPAEDDALGEHADGVLDGDAVDGAVVADAPDEPGAEGEVVEEPGGGDEGVHLAEP